MIAIGSDHGGYELKKEIMKHLSERGLEYRDFGTDSTASCDYPVYGKAVANAVAFNLRHGYRYLDYRKQSQGHPLCALPRLFFRRGNKAAQ